MPSNRRKKNRTKKQETEMTSQVELDGRPFDDDDYIQRAGDRDSDIDYTTEEVIMVSTNADEKYETTDASVSKYPEPTFSNKLEFDEDGAGSSCIKGNAESDTADSDTSSEIVEDDRNTRALAANEPTYKLETFEKNAMIIFNQLNVSGYKEPRTGTLEDGIRIRKTLAKFGFEGVEHLDLTRQEIFEKLNEFSSMDFTDYGCVAIVVMTHGGDQGLLMAKDKDYSEQHILNFFKQREIRKLVTKPVVVIIQACRGIKDMTAAEAGRKSKSGPEKDSMLREEVEHYYLPVEADTIVLHSSYIGKGAYRESDGSWFIESLCKNIEDLSKTHDLESIMVEVKREVAIKKYHREKNRRTGMYQINKQMPVVTSALMRKLYLRKYGDEPPIVQPLATAASNPVTSPSTSRDGVEKVVNSPYQPEQSLAEIFNHYEYLRNILQEYLKEKEDTMAEFLHRESASSEIKGNATHMRITHIAMSTFIRDRYRNTEKEKFILYYEF